MPEKLNIYLEETSLRIQVVKGNLPSRQDAFAQSSVGYSSNISDPAIGPSNPTRDVGTVRVLNYSYVTTLFQRYKDFNIRTLTIWPTDSALSHVIFPLASRFRQVTAIGYLRTSLARYSR